MIGNDLVSVVIPTYNGGRYIVSTINSALAQTYFPIEVIVVDDGSSDDLVSVLQPVWSRIHYVRQENKGPAAARNHGIRLSKGVYIAFLDHDDIWLPEKIAAHVALMKENPACGLVYSFHRLIDGSGKHIDNRAPLDSPSGKVLLDFAFKNRITTFSATLFRRSVFDVIGFLDESDELLTADDYDIYLRVLEKYEVLFAPGSPVYYRIHDGNLVKNYYMNYSATVAVLNRLLNRAKGNVDAVSYRKMKSATSRNLKREHVRYAYLLYYANDRHRAGILFKKAFFDKPWVFRNLAYFVICSLPQRIVAYLKT